ncbi:MAG: hypothetical protein F6K50_43510 [Moorea sp. SIO3I7]|uniref:hypothetical protein n=1 Tax=Moorena sp. SIO3F7 TaxID=2607839 RepID=UPI0013CBA000|nr:hypothetical protein [Moorena sp. SIO3F7]NEO02006.1 hypothetical protein [Moorena sp. SIO3I7]
MTEFFLKREAGVKTEVNSSRLLDVYSVYHSYEVHMIFSLFPLPSSLFPLPSSLLPAPCSLLPAPCTVM